MATDTESMHENMTRLRMRMVQQKLANERERLQRPESEPSDSNGYENQVKLQQAMLRRQELLDRIRQEQLEGRPRSYTPRKRYTPSPLPPLSRRSRRSLPDFNRKTFHFVGGGDTGGNQDMSGKVHHVIQHQFNTAPQQQQQPNYSLPPIQTGAVPALTAVRAVTPAEVVPVQPVQAMQPVTYGAYPFVSVDNKKRSEMFNKADFMDMMMLQNAQMHHMVMQQMMLQNLPGGRPATYPLAEPMVPMMRAPPSVYHHHINNNPPYQQPPMDYRGMGGNLGGMGRRYGPLLRKPLGRRGIPQIVRTDNKGGTRPSSVFLFGIILKEIVASLHRIYLNPNGNIYPVILDMIGPQAQDLTQLLYRDAPAGSKGGKREQDEARAKLLQILQYIIENLVYHMTEIMPKTGVLGTHKKSAVYEMIKTGKRYPDGYFWQIELDRLEFDGSGRTNNVGNLEAFILIVGIFLSRSFITTLLLKPVDYGLSNEPLSEVAERNIKLVASALLFLVRRVSTRRESPMLPMPGEVTRYVFTDDEMKPLHLRLRRTYEYCENLLREWGAEYIKRLRQATSQAAPADQAVAIKK